MHSSDTPLAWKRTAVDVRTVCLSAGRQVSRLLAHPCEIRKAFNITPKAEKKGLWDSMNIRAPRPARQGTNLLQLFNSPIIQPHEKHTKQNRTKQKYHNRQPANQTRPPLL